MQTSFEPHERREIAGRARTLHERLEGPGNEPGDGSVDADRVLAEWRDLFPDGESFAARLDRDGYTEAEIREQVTATRWPDGEPLPDWIDDVEVLLAHLDAATVDDDRPIPPPEGTPFGELLAVVVEFACERLPAERFPTPVLTGMGEWLFERLERLTDHALYVGFRSFLQERDADVADADPAAFDDPPSEHYDQFVDTMVGVGTRNLCLEYPVLARQLVVLVDQWTGAVTELYDRLGRDRTALEAEFGVEGAVTALEPLSEDSHG